jgi:hydantoinase/carbamoylase family amidase
MGFQPMLAAHGLEGRVTLEFQVPVNEERIEQDIQAIATFTETPGNGASRPTFSKSWRAARDYIARELESAGCKWRVDACGNLHARPNAVAWDASTWVSGSHIDSVPNGGNFDGVVGCVAPLEVFRAAKEDQKVVPLELIIWAEEEGTTFNLGMLGSRAWTGSLSREQLASIRNAQGQNYLEAGAEHGVVPDKIGVEKIKTTSIIGLIELHVEQGPGLWNDKKKAGVVNAIAGRRQFSCVLTGIANHAGSTSMRDRRDALAGMSEILLEFEKLAEHLGHRTVITIGQLFPKPNAINVINGEVTFTIDFRTPVTEILPAGDKGIHKVVEDIAARRHLIYALDVTESLPAIEMDARVCNRLLKSAEKRGLGQIPQTISGALHDAAILAPLVPTAMLFVPSRDGISHNSDEFSRIEDIAAATEVLAEAVRDRRID